MILAALSFLVVAQSSSEVPEGLMNNPVYIVALSHCYYKIHISESVDLFCESSCT